MKKHHFYFNNDVFRVISLSKTSSFTSVIADSVPFFDLFTVYT